MDLAVGLKRRERLDVDPGHGELPCFDSYGGREFAHRRVERVHAHRTLGRRHRGGAVAGGPAVPRDRKRVDVVLVGAQIELAQMLYRRLVHPRGEIARTRRQACPHAMRERIDRTQRCVALEERVRLVGLIPRLSLRATQQQFDEIGVIGEAREERAHRRVVEFDRRHRRRRPLPPAQREARRTRAADRVRPRLRDRGEPSRLRFRHLRFRGLVARHELERECAQRRLRVKPPRADLARRPREESRAGIPEKVLARYAERAAQRRLLADSLGIRVEQRTDRVPSVPLLHVLDHPAPLRVGLRAVGRLLGADEGPVDRIEIEQPPLAPRVGKHEAVLECPRRVLERDRHRFGQPVRDAVLRHRERDGVRVLVAQHRERIEEPEVLVARTLLRDLDRDGRAGADRDGVDARKARDAHAEAAVVGHHIDERLLRRLVAQAAADLVVHRVEDAREKLRDERGVAFGMADDEVLRLDAVPARELLGELQREQRALVMRIERDGQSQVLDRARLAAVLHREKPELGARRDPGGLARGCEFERRAGLFILPVEDQLAPGDQQRLCGARCACVAFGERRAHRVEVVACRFGGRAHRKALVRTVVARKDRREQVARTHRVVRHETRAHIEKRRVGMHRIDAAQRSRRARRADEVEAAKRELAEPVPRIGRAWREFERLLKRACRLAAGVALGQQLCLAQADSRVKPVERVAGASERAQELGILAGVGRIEPDRQRPQIDRRKHFIHLFRPGERGAHRVRVHDRKRLVPPPDRREALGAKGEQRKFRRSLGHAKDGLGIAHAGQGTHPQHGGHGRVGERRVEVAAALEGHEGATRGRRKVEIVVEAVANAEVAALFGGQIGGCGGLQDGRRRCDRLRDR